MSTRFVTLFVLAFTVCAATATESPCTLDTQQFLRDARALAASKPAAELDERTYTVSWRDKVLGRVSVSIGGCSHYGLRVASVRKLARPMADRELRHYAAGLVGALWPKPYSAEIANALQNAKSNSEIHGDRKVDRFNVTGFDEVILEYKHEAGTLTIEVSALVPT